jgi:hypothetical protein
MKTKQRVDVADREMKEGGWGMVWQDVEEKVVRLPWNCVIHTHTHTRICTRTDTHTHTHTAAWCGSLLGWIPPCFQPGWHTSFYIMSSNLTVPYSTICSLHAEAACVQWWLVYFSNKDVNVCSNLVHIYLTNAFFPILYSWLDLIIYWTYLNTTNITPHTHKLFLLVFR